jgi:hypothetical protein
MDEHLGTCGKTKVECQKAFDEYFERRTKEHKASGSTMGFGVGRTCQHVEDSETQGE